LKKRNQMAQHAVLDFVKCAHAPVVAKTSGLYLVCISGRDRELVAEVSQAANLRTTRQRRKSSRKS
jgi:hypothetical protein